MEHPNNMILWMITSICILGLSQSDEVRVPPTITEHPEADIILNLFRKFDFICQASGNPNPTITWRVSNNPGGPWNLVKDTQSVTILNTKDDENRYYQCSARNKWGTALSRITHLSKAYLKRSRMSRMGISYNVAVDEGDGKMLSCGDFRSSLEELEYSWQKVHDVGVDSSGPYVEGNNRISFTEEGSLVFASVLRTDVDDAYPILKCRAAGHYGDSGLVGSYYFLQINKVDNIVNKKPKIMYSTESKEALKGKKKVLECFFSGHPAPHVSWSKSGGIPDNASPDGNKLVIKNIDFMHEGEYKCTGKNSEGSAEKTLKLTVAASPYWESEEDKPYNLEVVEGQTAEFVCKPTAVPEANVVWMKNTEVLDPSNPGLKTTIVGSKLMIKGVCKNCDEPDIANYHCYANNKHGYAFSSGYLNVITKTKMTVKPRNRDLTKLEKDTKKIELLCDAVGDPIRPLEFIWLKDDKLIEDQENVANIDKATNTLTLFLEVYATKEEMYDALAGIYKCQATNGVSTAFATATLIGPKRWYIGPKRWYIGLIIAVIVLVGFLVLAGVVYFAWRRSRTEDDKNVDAIQDPTTGDRLQVPGDQAKPSLELQVPGNQAKPSLELQVPGNQAISSQKKSIVSDRRPSKLANAPRKLSHAPRKLSNAPRKLSNAPRKL